MKRYYCEECGNRYRSNQTMIYKDRKICPICKVDLKEVKILVRRRGIRRRGIRK